MELGKGLGGKQGRGLRQDTYSLVSFNLLAGLHSPECLGAGVLCLSEPVRAPACPSPAFRQPLDRCMVLHPYASVGFPRSGPSLLSSSGFQLSSGTKQLLLQPLPLTCILSAVTAFVGCQVEILLSTCAPAVCICSQSMLLSHTLQPATFFLTCHLALPFPPSGNKN